jgi:hypothetical protein
MMRERIPSVSRKHGSQKVVDDELHRGFRHWGRRPVLQKGFGNQLKEQAIGDSSAPVHPPYWFKPQMRNELLTGQMESHMPDDARRRSEDGHGTCRINENDVADGKLEKLVFMIDSRATRHLKDCAVVLEAVKTRMPLSALDLWNIASRIKCLQAAQAEGAQPTREYFWFDTHRIVRASQVYRRYPLVAA